MSDRFVDLLRHGEVAGGGRFRGAHDDPLTARGWAQMQAACAGSEDQSPGPASRGPAPWDLILCSPARRCADFAAHLGQRCGLPVQPLADLRERAFGAWEGRTAAEIPIEELSRFWADPLGYDPPGAEPFSAFRTRVVAAWEGIRDGPHRHPLLITHGGVVRIIIGAVLGISADRLLLLEVPPACRTRLRVPTGGGYPSLMRHGESGA